MKRLILPLLLTAVTFAPVSLSAGDPPSNVEQAKPVVVDGQTLEKLKVIAQQAAREGDVTTLEAYLQAGYPQDIVTDRGDTLLILAAYYGRKEAVETLLELKTTKVDAVNAMGFTALAGAAFKGHEHIALLLLEHGASVNGSNRAKQTPLMFAALFNRTKLAEELIKRGANVEAKDLLGNTALALATKQGHAEMVAILNEGLSQKRWIKQLDAQPAKGVVEFKPTVIKE